MASHCKSLTITLDWISYSFLIALQYLMEGNYNKVFLARGNVPADSYHFFMNILLDTLRSVKCVGCAHRLWNCKTHSTLLLAYFFFLFFSLFVFILFSSTLPLLPFPSLPFPCFWVKVFLCEKAKIKLRLLLTLFTFVFSCAGMKSLLVRKRRTSAFRLLRLQEFCTLMEKKTWELLLKR